MKGIAVMKIKTPCFPFGIPGEVEPILYCFHHAGGNANQLRDWAGVNRDVAVIPIEYAGHGARMCEPFADSISGIACDIADAIERNSNGRRIFIYGHSFGALIAFETVKVLEQKGVPVQKLIVAGRGAPYDSDYSNFRTAMGRDALLDELRRLGGMDEEMLLDERFVDYFAPIILSDLALIEQYMYDGTLINCPISAHCSRNDIETSPEQMSHWQTVTHGCFNEKLFEGNHFFVLENTDYLNDLLLEIYK